MVNEYLNLNKKLMTKEFTITINRIKMKGIFMDVYEIIFRGEHIQMLIETDENIDFSPNTIIDLLSEKFSKISIGYRNWFILALEEALKNIYAEHLKKFDYSLKKVTDEIKNNEQRFVLKNVLFDNDSKNIIEEECRIELTTLSGTHITGIIDNISKNGLKFEDGVKIPLKEIYEIKLINTPQDYKNLPF